MNLECSVSGISHLTSRPQQVRVMTEGWFGRCAYCIACASEHVVATRANTAARDFVCDECGQAYELKSSRSAEGKRVVDGAYSTMIKRIKEDKAPSLVLLQYKRDLQEAMKPWSIERLVAIHPIFLTEVAIEARPPLSADARRAGWRGCNIRLDRVPADGRIEIVTNGAAVAKGLVRQRFASAQRLASISLETRGWTSLVLGIVRQINATTFDLSQVYARRRVVEAAFPKNNNIEAKLRQQLQILRDLGYIEFLGRGSYRVLL